METIRKLKEKEKDEKLLPHEKERLDIVWHRILNQHSDIVIKKLFEVKTYKDFVYVFVDGFGYIKWGQYFPTQKWVDDILEPQEFCLLEEIYNKKYNGQKRDNENKIFRDWDIILTYKFHPEKFNKEYSANFLSAAARGQSEYHRLYNHFNFIVEPQKALGAWGRGKDIILELTEKAKDIIEKFKKWRNEKFKE